MFACVYAHHQREQAPGGHIAGRRAAEGDGADLGLIHVTVREDAGQHRNGDGHGNTMVQRETGEWNRGMREERIERQREHGPKGERQQNAGVR